MWIEKKNRNRQQPARCAVWPLCVGHAAARHVGRWQAVFTPDGEVQVQTGRDLTHTAKIIGSGGWLSRAADFNPADWFAAHAVDGSFNATAETVEVTIPTAGLAPGKHLVWIQGINARNGGTAGTPDAVFIEIIGEDRLFADGFESR